MPQGIPEESYSHSRNRRRKVDRRSIPRTSSTVCTPLPRQACRSWRVRWVDNVELTRTLPLGRFGRSDYVRLFQSGAGGLHFHHRTPGGAARRRGASSRRRPSRAVPGAFPEEPNTARSRPCRGGFRSAETRGAARPARAQAAPLPPRSSAAAVKRTFSPATSRPRRSRRRRRAGRPGDGRGHVALEPRKLDGHKKRAPSEDAAPRRGLPVRAIRRGGSWRAERARRRRRRPDGRRAAAFGRGSPSRSPGSRRSGDRLCRALAPAPDGDPAERRRRRPSPSEGFRRGRAGRSAAFSHSPSSHEAASLFDRVGERGSSHRRGLEHLDSDERLGRHGPADCR